MSEINKLVDVYQVVYQCDECQIADVILNSNPAIDYPYTYKCPNCSATVQLSILYPYTVYK